MNKVAIVYWSGTGNTEQMAQAVAEGVKNAGGEADVLTCAEFDSAKLADYGAVAFGCPAMGAEQLELWPVAGRLVRTLQGRRRCDAGRTWRYGKRSAGRRCNRSLQRSGRKAGSLLSKVS